MGGKAGEKDQERPEGISRLVSASFCLGEKQLLLDQVVPKSPREVGPQIGRSGF